MQKSELEHLRAEYKKEQEQNDEKTLRIEELNYQLEELEKRKTA